MRPKSKHTNEIGMIFTLFVLRNQALHWCDWMSKYWQAVEHQSKWPSRSDENSRRFSVRLFSVRENFQSDMLSLSDKAISNFKSLAALISPAAIYQLSSKTLSLSFLRALLEYKLFFRRKNKEYTPVMLERERKTTEIWKQNHTRASGGVQKLDSTAWGTEKLSWIQNEPENRHIYIFFVLHKTFSLQISVCLPTNNVGKQMETSCTWHCCWIPFSSHHPPQSPGNKCFPKSIVPECLNPTWEV